MSQSYALNRPVLFVLLVLFWIMLTWPADWGPADWGPADWGPADWGPADWGPWYWQDLLTGVVVALITTWIVGDPTPATERLGKSRWLQPARYFWALVYVFVLAAYIVKANFEVAYRVLHPAMPIRPGIVKVRTRLRRPASLTALSNSITLTPGTLAVDVREEGTMLVHWIYVRTEDEEEAARRILGRFEWFVERIFE